MAQTARDTVMIQLDKVDTALEAPDADKGAVLRDAQDWLSGAGLEAADALYYRERLQAIRERHRIA